MATPNNDNTPAIQAAALFGVTRIRVIETSATKDYYVSTNLLNQNAPGFSTNFQMEDSTMSHIEVDDCAIETFDIFMAWLHREQARDFFVNYTWPTGMAMIQLWLFALRHAPHLQQLKTDLKLQLESDLDLKIVFTVAEINHTYEHTRDGCYLRRAIVSAFCDVPNAQQDVDQCCAKFLADAFKYMRAKHNSWMDMIAVFSLQTAE